MLLCLLSLGVLPCERGGSIKNRSRDHAVVVDLADVPAHKTDGAVYLSCGVIRRGITFKNFPGIPV